MIQNDPLHSIVRTVKDGYETVSLTYAPDWLYVLKLISADSRESYKKAMTEICGYPVEEWTRVKEIVPCENDDKSWTVRVVFRNPGKQFEEFLRTHDTSMLDHILILNEGEASPNTDGTLIIKRDAFEWCHGG